MFEENAKDLNQATNSESLCQAIGNNTQDITVKIEIDVDFSATIDQAITERVRQDTNVLDGLEVHKNDSDLANRTEINEAENKKIEFDFDNIINSSQVTLDNSLSNISLDNFSNIVEMPPEFNSTVLEWPGTQNNEVVKLEDNADTDIIDLDEFEKLFQKDEELNDIEDIIDEFIIENVGRSNINASCLAKEVNQSKKEVTIDISNNDYAIDDIITLSSDDDSSFVNDLETISISSQEISVDENNNNVKKYTNRETVIEQCLKCVDDEKADSKCETVNENNTFTETFDDNTCSSYDSSAFEFITEEEARKDILFTKGNRVESNTGTLRTIEVNQDSCFNDSDSSQNYAGPSCSNSTNYRSAIARFHETNFTNTTHRQNHRVPEGDRFLDMFRGGIFSPTVPYIIENKSTMASSMYVQYEGIGFDMRAVSVQDSDDEFKEEAEECANKILEMYPAENGRKRRRH